jgi:hypothetical protein
MKHSVAHDLGLERARKVTDSAFASYKAKLMKYHPETRWVSERRAEITFSVKGIKLKGAVEVSPSAIEMELDVPLLFRPFRGVAMGIVEQEIREWVERAKAGEV